MKCEKDNELKQYKRKPVLIFELIKKKNYSKIEELISLNIVPINTTDFAGNNVMMRLLKNGQYDLVLQFMSKRSWDVNHQNFDGNTFGHLLAKDDSIHCLKIIMKLTKNKRYIPNIKNNKGQTVLDLAIHSRYIYTAIKILEDRRFNNIDISSFKRLLQVCLNNTSYGKYTKINHLEIIIDSMEKKEELRPNIKKIVDEMKDNFDIIKNEIMTNDYKVLDTIFKATLESGT